MKISEQLEQRRFLMHLNDCLESMCRKLFDFYGSCDDCLHPICCTASSPSLLPHEIGRISQHLGMSEKKFKKRYVVKLNLPRIKRRVVEPCPFLKDDCCAIYEKRPHSCRTFPFESSVLMGSVRLESVTMCPIATLISEEFNDFIDEYEYLVPETKETKAFNEEMAKANQEIQDRIAESLEMDDSHENWFMMTSLLFFVCFYNLKVRGIADVERDFRRYLSNHEAFVETLMSEGG